MLCIIGRKTQHTGFKDEGREWRKFHLLATDAKKGLEAQKKARKWRTHAKERHHTVNNDIKGEKMEAIFGHPVHSDGLATIGF